MMARNSANQPGPAGASGQPERSLAETFDPQRNNFDLIRLALAILVIFCHSFSLKGGEQEPVGKYLHYGYGGTLAVYGFLVISGFLVTRSASDRPLGAYVAARALRILPGLALITLVEVFVIGPYFTKDGLWVYLTYVGFRHLRNVAVFGLDSQMWGIFEHTDPPWMMNGSIWTIPIECSYYIVLPLISLFFGLKRSIIGIFLLSLLTCAALNYAGLFGADPGPSLFTNVHLMSFLDFATYFFAGSAMWVARDRIPFSRGALAIALIALYAAAGVGLSDAALRLFLPYVVIYASLMGGLGSQLKRWVGDLSYGTYLFGFPVALSVIELDGSLGIYPTFFITLAITLACAWLSWHLVERPCLRLRSGNRLNARQRHLSAAR